jgi:hypothetical protein
MTNVKIGSRGAQGQQTRFDFWGWVLGGGQFR